MTLVILSTHPVQYHAPVYREIQANHNIPVTAVYGSDFSIAGYRDAGFGVQFAWDSDLLSGYSHVFLTRVNGSGNNSISQISKEQISAALQELSPEVILLQGYQGRYAWAAFRAACEYGAPLLFRAETTDHAVHRNPAKAWVRRQYLRWFYRHFCVLLPIGSRSFSHYSGLGVPSERLVCAPYCVDVAAFQCDESARATLRSAARTEMGVDSNTVVVLFSGKLAPQKAPDLLVAAVEQWSTEISQKVAILFLGDGEMRSTLSSMASNRVLLHFAGFHNQSQLSRYYHAADLLVLPSRGETWGLVVNEALHHGLPCVVSSAVGCAPDLVLPGLTGEVFTSGSVDALVQALNRSLMLLDRLDVRVQCRNLAANYSVAQAAAGIAQGYKLALRNGR